MPDIFNTLSWRQWVVVAAAAGAIVLLYFLKLKRRPLEVPSTYLWRKSVEDLHVNAIWQRLRRNLLLLLQLLVMLLATVALLRPSWQGTEPTGSRLIFLVDCSASMSATDVKPSRLEEAKRQVGNLIDQMRSGDAAMLVSFSDTAQVEQTFTGDRRQLRRALMAIRPTCRSTSLGEALKLAAGLNAPNRGGEKGGETGRQEGVIPKAEAQPTTLYIFSDGCFGPVAGVALSGLDPKFMPIGSSDAENVAITALSVRRNESRPDRLEAFARLENFGRKPVGVTLKLFHDGRLIDADRADVLPDESRGAVFDLRAVGAGSLTLKAVTNDDFGLDDVAYATIQPPRRSRVLLVTPGNEPLRVALQTRAAVELADVRIETPEFLRTKTYAEQAAAGVWQLVIYDRCRPERMAAANTLWVGVLPPEGGWALGAKVAEPQIIDTAAAHPLMEWLDLGDVLVAEATPLRPPRGGSVLIDSNVGPLMAIAPRGAFEDAVLGFVILGEETNSDGKSQQYLGTNWLIRTSFPVFWLNVLDYFGGNRVSANVFSARPGMPVLLERPERAASETSSDAAVPAHSSGGGKRGAEFPRGVATLQVRTPSGRTIKTNVSDGGVAFADTGELGVYDVLSGGKTVRRFAVNLFDPAESGICTRPAPVIKIGDHEIVGEVGERQAKWEMWKYLVMAALVVLFAEWYIYIRRIY